MKLSDCSVVLTGASGGIGAATARALVAAGARVLLVARRLDPEFALVIAEHHEDLVPDAERGRLPGLPLLGVRELERELANGSSLHQWATPAAPCSSIRAPVLNRSSENGRASGYFMSTGIRPSFIPRLESHGVRLPASAFRERVMLRD